MVHRSEMCTTDTSCNGEPGTLTRFIPAPGEIAYRIGQISFSHHRTVFFLLVYYDFAKTNTENKAHLYAMCTTLWIMINRWNRNGNPRSSHRNRWTERDVMMDCFHEVFYFLYINVHSIVVVENRVPRFD